MYLSYFTKYPTLPLTKAAISHLSVTMTGTLQAQALSQDFSKLLKHTPEMYFNNHKTWLIIYLTRYFVVYIVNQMSDIVINYKIMRFEFKQYFLNKNKAK